MSGSMRDLRRRIRALNSTEQLTRAMRTVAASKYSRLQQMAKRYAPYAETSLQFLQAADTPDVAKRNTNRVLYVCFTANRGLCGAYNIDLMRALSARLASEERECGVIFAGRWGAENAAVYEIDPVLRSFPAEDFPTFPQAQALSAYLWEQWESGQVSEVCLVFQQGRSILTLEPVFKPLLPLPVSQHSDTEVFMEPGPESLLPKLQAQYVSATVYSAMLTAAEGAQGAMMNAMRQASDNAADMLRELTLEKNRLRQQAVTTEMLELAGSKNAMRNSEDSHE